jgi:hypothetical protein
VGIGITFVCFDGEDGVIFFVFEVTADDVLIDVDDGFHGCPKYGNTGIKYGNTGIKYGNTGKGWLLTALLFLLVARFVVLGRVREEHEDLL